MPGRQAAKDLLRRLRLRSPNEPEPEQIRRMRQVEAEYDGELECGPDGFRVSLAPVVLDDATIARLTG